MDGQGKVKHSKEIHLHLKKQHYDKFLKKQGFTLNNEDLSNTEYPNKISLTNIHPSFHKRFRSAIRHKKSMRFQKKDYEHLGSGIKKEDFIKEEPNIKETIKKSKKPKKNIEHKESKSSSQGHLHIPNGQLLKGVQIEGTGYELPLSTDIHTFATKKRIKK